MAKTATVPFKPLPAATIRKMQRNVARLAKLAESELEQAERRVATIRRDVVSLQALAASLQSRHRLFNGASQGAGRP